MGVTSCHHCWWSQKHLVDVQSWGWSLIWERNTLEGHSSVYRDVIVSHFCEPHYFEIAGTGFRYSREQFAVGFSGSKGTSSVFICENTALETVKQCHSLFRVQDVDTTIISEDGVRKSSSQLMVARRFVCKFWKYDSSCHRRHMVVRRLVSHVREIASTHKEAWRLLIGKVFSLFWGQVTQLCVILFAT